MKYRIHIKADSDEAVKEELREVAEIITGLRESTKKWQEEFGHQNKGIKEKWEKMADAWINKHKVFYHEKTNGVLKK